MDMKSQVTGEFAATYAAEPTGVWSSPGRVNLIGEHTDYNHGLVLPIALPQRTYAAARTRIDGLLCLQSKGMGAPVAVRIDGIAPGSLAGWERYPAGVIWALNQAGYPVSGLDVSFASDVPVGAGLSSSAAIEGAVAAAASDLFGLNLLTDDVGRTTLASLCQRAENEIAQAPTGGMDQAAALRCEDGHALYLDCSDGSTQQIPFDLTGKGLTLLVINTLAAHELSDGQYGKRRRDCEKACKKLGIESLREIGPSDLPVVEAKLGKRGRKRVRHVVTEIQRVRQAVAAIEAKDFAELGTLFVESHASLRDDYEVSCEELDLAVVTALEAGALGARMTGGGFGGSAIALVYEQAVEPTITAITSAFTLHDFRVPQCFVAVASGPAMRVD